MFGFLLYQNIVVLLHFGDIAIGGFDHLPRRHSKIRTNKAGFF